MCVAELCHVNALSVLADVVILTRLKMRFVRQLRRKPRRQLRLLGRKIVPLLWIQAQFEKTRAALGSDGNVAVRILWSSPRRVVYIALELDVLPELVIAVRD